MEVSGFSRHTLAINLLAYALPMKSLWIYVDADGKSRVKPLPLPIYRVTEPVDAELFRRQARGEDMRRPRLPGSTGLRAMRIVGDRTDPWRTADARNLVLVVSGRVELKVGDGRTCSLGPGDILFASPEFLVG